MNWIWCKWQRNYSHRICLSPCSLFAFGFQYVKLVIFSVVFALPLKSPVESETMLSSLGKSLFLPYGPILCPLAFYLSSSAKEIHIQKMCCLVMKPRGFRTCCFLCNMIELLGCGAQLWMLIESQSFLFEASFFSLLASDQASGGRGRVLSLHTAYLFLTPYTVPWALPGVIPECKVSSSHRLKTRKNKIK